MDEEALLKQFAAQFAHGPDDADDTDAAGAWLLYTSDAVDE